MINYKPEYNWIGRSLSNYLQIHANIVRSKGLDPSKIKTLTEARKQLFGYKKRNSK